MFKIPLYVTVLILIVLSFFLIVRENFIGFDEEGVPKEKRYPFIPKSSFAKACLH